LPRCCPCNLCFYNFEFVSFPLQLEFLDVEVPEKDHGSLPIDTTSSQAPVAPREPETFDVCTEHISRIADLKSWVTILKHQTMTAMDQANISSALSQKVSSLENQMSVLMAKIGHLEECDLYMTEIIEAASDQLSSKLLGAP
jgi:hypothetical protein